jgi:integrase
MRKDIHIHFGTEPAPAAPPILRVVPVAPAGRMPRPGDSLTWLTPGADINAAASYLATLRPSGRRSMRARLDRAAALILAGTSAGTFPWGSLRYEHVIYVRTRLVMAGASEATINLTLVALRQVARAARQLGQMPVEAEIALRDVDGVSMERVPRGRMLSTAEQAALFDVCALDESAAGRRDACLLALMLGAGLRRDECAALPVEAFDAEAGTLRLVGKGGREAIVPLVAQAARAITDWLEVRGRRPGALLAPVSRTGRVTAARALSAQGVYRAVVRRAREAGIKRCTPHDLRRTYISELLDVADGETVRKLARHSNLSTTGRYDRRGEQAKKKAIRMLSLPYKRPRPKRMPKKARSRRRRRRVNKAL